MFPQFSGRKERSGEDCDLLKPLLTQPVLVQRSHAMFSTTATRGGEQVSSGLAATSIQGANREVAS